MTLRNDKGQALVEMALGLFVLAIILIAIIEFGYAFHIKNSLANSARAGVRQAVVTSGITNQTATLNAIPNNTNTPVYNAVVSSLPPALATNQKPYITVQISGASSPVAKGNTINITVRWTNYAPFTNFALERMSITSLSGTASMRYE